MNNLTFFSLPVLYCLVLTTLLGGCFDTGVNQGSNKVLLNGSVLKGTIANADVRLLNSQGNAVWQGRSDGDGQFSGEYIPGTSQFYTLFITPGSESLMLCDATACAANSPDKEYRFGEFIPGSQLGGNRLKGAFYPQESMSVFGADQQEVQVNAFSTLVLDILEPRLNQSLSAPRYQQLAQVGSEIVAAAFGMDTGDIGDLLQLPLPDIGKENSLDNSAVLTATLGLINAGQALDLALLADFSLALNGFIRSQLDEAAKARLIDLQHLYLSEVQSIIDSDLVSVKSEQVRQNIHQYLVNGVNFSGLSDAIKQLSVLTGKKPASIKSSSQYWGASVRHTAGQWWWVSASEPVQQWVLLQYPQAFVPAQIKIGLSNRFEETGGKIEASNDGALWQELATTLTSAEADIDERNIRHFSLALEGEDEYSYYRYLSEPTPSVWLEYLCVYQSNFLASAQPCRHSQVPKNASASSFRFSAENVIDPEPKTWWLSEFASGREEWLQMYFEQAFIAKRATLIVKQDNQGSLPSIQGSHDGKTWILLTPISGEAYPGEWTDTRDFRHLDIKLDNDEAYRYYRYHSQPSTFVWIEYLDFSD